MRLVVPAFSRLIAALMVSFAINANGAARAQAEQAVQDETPKPSKQDMAGADPQDPFVRGLKRLDERLRLQRETEELARKALQLQQAKEGEKADGEMIVEEEMIIPAPISDPDFFTAFAARKYRLDGLVLSKPQTQPVIHVLNEVEKPKSGQLFWSGRERRWVYQRNKDETLSSIARKLVMQVDDMLAMNNALRESQLADPMRFYVSPRDNGPLTHIVLRSDTIAKITNDRIMLTDANGYLLTLPLNWIPEIDPEEKRRAAEAARKAALDKAAKAAGAAADAAGSIDPNVPEAGDTALGQRLMKGEAARREGSQNFIKKLAEKPKKIDEK